MTDSQQATQQKEAVAGWWQQLGILYLQMALDSLKRGLLHLERLRTQWHELLPDERRQVAYATNAALDSAENSASAIAAWKGLTKELTEKLENAKQEREKSGNTSKAKVTWFLARAKIVEEILLASGVLLEPKQSAEDIYYVALESILAESTPLFTDEEKSKLGEDALKTLIRERFTEITGYLPPGETGEEPEETNDAEQ